MLIARYILISLAYCFCQKTRIFFGDPEKFLLVDRINCYSHSQRHIKSIVSGPFARPQISNKPHILNLRKLREIIRGYAYHFDNCNRLLPESAFLPTSVAYQNKIPSVWYMALDVECNHPRQQRHSDLIDLSKKLEILSSFWVWMVI